MATKKKKKTAKRDNRLRQNDRIKTDVRMSPELGQTIEKVVTYLGATKNSFFTLAVARAVVGVAPLCFRDKKTREKVLKAIEAEFQATLKKVREA